MKRAGTAGLSPAETGAFTGAVPHGPGQISYSSYLAPKVMIAAGEVDLAGINVAAAFYAQFHLGVSYRPIGTPGMYFGTRLAIARVQSA
ncbi:MAG TPA: hypothetical protein VL574_05585 [Stellaceae bacterium]|nr:hypothetical protein [Stellaceae bacterium]